MRLRGRWLPCVGLMLLFPIQSQAQERTPVREWGRPAAVTASVPSSSRGVSQASGSRSGRDSLINGTVIGAVIGAVAGRGLAYATNDSVLGVEQFSYAALVFGGILGRRGVGIDALLNRGPGVLVGSTRRIAVKTRVSRTTAGVGVTMRW